MEEIKNFVKSLEKYGKKEKKQDFSDKKYLKELISQERKKKKTIEPIELSIKLGTSQKLVEDILNEINEESKPKEVKKPKKPSKLKNYVKQKKDKTKKILDKEDKQTIKEIILKILLYGIPLNFAIFILSKGFFIFNFYSWIGWGVSFWLIKKEVVPILRSIIHK